MMKSGWRSRNIVVLLLTTNSLLVRCSEVQLGTHGLLEQSGSQRTRLGFVDDVWSSRAFSDPPAPELLRDADYILNKRLPKALCQAAWLRPNTSKGGGVEESDELRGRD